MQSPSKLVSAAAERNRGPIGDVLEGVLPERGVVLEIAAGTGQHAVTFAERFRALTWQPSDLDEQSLESIAAWVDEAALPNLRSPLRLDVCQPSWPLERAAAVFCANMTHISPWHATLGLLDGAARALTAGSPLVIYGPFNIDRQFTSESNARFDASLRARDSRWGIRDLEEVSGAASERGLELERRVQMPANNQTLIFRRS